MKKLWFRNKTYGYGWYPASWEGWLTIAIYLTTVILTIPIIQSVTNTRTMFAVIFTPTISIATAILLFVAYKKGEKPEWRWGKKTENK